MAVKNLVITEQAYKIELDNQTDFAVCACPRCGHVQERKPRTICGSCKRFIPHVPSRQSWDEGSMTARDPYTAAFIKENAAQAPECRFKVARQKPIELVRALREYGIFFLIAVVVWYSAPLVLTAVVGKEGVKKLELSIQTTAAVITTPHAQKHRTNERSHWF